MSTPFDALTTAVTGLIAAHKTLQTNHAALQAQVATQDVTVQALTAQINSLCTAAPVAPSVATGQPMTPAQAVAYGKQAGQH